MVPDVVVFLPGICGSVLMLGDETIWPGTAWNVRFQTYPDRYVDLLASSTELRATEVLRNVPLQVFGVPVYHFDGYGRALDALEDMGFGIAGGRLIPFAYDWRLDIRTTAQGLHDRLSQADLAGKRIAIVAHSMGGLVARTMLENLGIPASVKIEQCVLVAVPHLGAPVALQNVLGLRPELFLSGPQCKLALRDARFPSAYQLLPHAGVPALLQASAVTGFAIQDMFGDATAQRFDLTTGSLAAARSLGEGLVPIGPGFVPPCRYVAIAGNAQKTITANYLGGGGGAEAVEEPTGGDGTVPVWSAAPPGIPVRFVAATHGAMFADRDTIAMLRAVLRPGEPGGRLFSVDPLIGLPRLSAQAVQASVAVGGSITIAIVADRPTDRMDAMIEITRVFEGNRTETEEAKLHYEGGKLRSIPMDFAAPQERAVLRFRVCQTGALGEGDEATVLVI